MLSLKRLLILFAAGSLFGWISEVLIKAASIALGRSTHMINPGFLSGPYLPIYGSGILLVYFISTFKVHIAIKAVLFAVTTTTLELVTGFLFLTILNMRLWEYLARPFNYAGYIAPVHSLYWLALALMFYFLVYPRLDGLLAKLEKRTDVVILLGMFYCVLMADLIITFSSIL